MDNSAIKQYRDTLVKERDAELSAVNQRYSRKLAALDVLLEDERPKSKAPTRRDVFTEFFGPPQRPTSERKAKNLFEAACEAIRHASGDFSSVSLYESYVKPNYGDMANQPTDLSNPLWRLRKAGHIEVVTASFGQAPAIYRKTSTFDEAYPALL